MTGGLRRCRAHVRHARRVAVRVGRAKDENELIAPAVEGTRRVVAAARRAGVDAWC